VSALVAEPEPEFAPGDYVITFERIGAHRPAPLTLTATTPEEMEAKIRQYANTYTRSVDILVCVEPPEPGRSLASGWISAGGRDAGGFTWKAVATGSGT